MALAQCRECGAQISTQAETCPHCGIARPAAGVGSLADARPDARPDAASARGRKRRWPRRLLFLGVVIFLFWAAGGFLLVMKLAGVDTETLLSDELPKCNSKTTLDLAKRAIETSPMAKIVNLTAFEFQDVREIAYDPQAPKRTCGALAYMNSGKHDVQFTVEWANQEKREIWLQFQSLE